MTGKRFLHVAFLLILSQGYALANTHMESLSPKQEAIIPIAAFTANGDEEKLKAALISGLDASLTINEIKEVLIQMYAYAGFPRALTGLSTFMNVVEDREKAGKNDPEGSAPKRIPDNADKYAIGEKVQTGLVGKPVSGSLYEFCPDIGVFLKAHLFCDIFARHLLSEQDREIATTSALAALPAPAQLASHIRVCLNIGLTPEQLREFVRIIGEKVGRSQAELAGTILNKILT